MSIKTNNKEEDYYKSEWLKCLLCGAITPSDHPFYDHLEDIHMMPIRRMRLDHFGVPREETHQECMERFRFNYKEYGTETCWCPDCLGGETLKLVSEICSLHGQLYVREKHNE